MPELPIIEEPDTGVADFVFGAELGVGGMGIVTLAEQTSLGRDVAIKTLKEDAPKGAAQALIREARHAGRLEHPNIIPVHMLGRDTRGRPMLVMKRVEGVAWSDLIRDPEHSHWRTGNFPADFIERHVLIAIEVCRAMQFAHSRGILHRDLKPDNVMIGPFGEVYVLDWGLALAYEGKNDPRVVGTPSYMAPEMLFPSERAGPPTDVYLIGGCLLKALTKKSPHHGANMREMMMSAMTSGRPDFPDWMPAELADIITRCMSREQVDRFTDGGEIRAALMLFNRHRSVVPLVDAARAHFELAKANPAAVGELRAAEFGFRQALELWEHAEGANQGLGEVLALTVRRCLERDEMDAAESALLELATLQGDADRDLELTQEVMVAREAWDVLRARAVNMDPRKSRAVRIRFFTGLMFAMALVSIGQWPLVANALFAYNTTYLWAAAALLIVPVTLVGVVARNALLSNEMNQRVALLEAVPIVGILANRTAGMLYGTNPGVVLSNDMFFICIAAVAAGLYVRRPLLYGGLPFYAGGVVALMAPAWAPHIFTMASLAFVALLIRVNWSTWSNQPT